MQLLSTVPKIAQVDVICGVILPLTLTASLEVDYRSAEKGVAIGEAVRGDVGRLMVDWSVDWAETSLGAAEFIHSFLDGWSLAATLQKVLFSIIGHFFKTFLPIF